MVFEEGEGGAGDCLAAGGGGCRDVEVGAVAPAADAKEDFQMAVAFLQEMELFEAAVYVGTGVVPAVGGVVFVCVGWEGG